MSCSIKGNLSSVETKYGKLNKEIIIRGVDQTDATASIDDVLKGKTFYARQDPKIKTGVLQAFDINQIITNETSSLAITSLTDKTLQNVRVMTITNNGSQVPVGIDTSDATITPESVENGKIGYGANNARITGTLNAYNVVEEILTEDTSRIIISSIGSGNTDAMIIAQNIEMMKSADLTEIQSSGGTLASDLQYAQAEAYIQQIARVLLGVTN